ncbi:MAG: nicotinate-nucleotide--dimethylbenzimidazole phosphoribosyltransferase [Methylophilaceae bacterium]
MQNTQSYSLPIDPINSELKARLQSVIDNKTKPLGALGLLEKIALQIGQIQDSLAPILNRPAVLVFAGDHGIVEEGVSSYPQVVTSQMVMNFLSGGAAINVFASQHQFEIRVIDSGVNFKFENTTNLVHAKIANGTKNFLHTPAMTELECGRALTLGQAFVNKEIDAGTNIFAFGEMGIGNTSSASCLMSILCELPIAKCVGRGTGLNDAGLIKKTKILRKALEKHAVDSQNVLGVLATFGGYEIAMMVGAMLGAAQKRSVLLIDGFIATAALLVASKMQPNIMQYCIFSHCSDEAGHTLLLRHLEVEPLLNLGLRLGEGTGAVLAYPLVKSAADFLNNMASFTEAGVSKKENVS